MRSILLRGQILLLALAIVLFMVFSTGGMAWASWDQNAGGAPAHHAQENVAEANLPFLYAVYSITWAAFFGYLFLVSRRQRELRKEIEALRKALEEKSKKESAKGQ